MATYSGVSAISSTLFAARNSSDALPLYLYLVVLHLAGYLILLATVDGGVSELFAIALFSFPEGMSILQKALLAELKEDNPQLVELSEGTRTGPVLRMQATAMSMGGAAAYFLGGQVKIDIGMAVFGASALLIWVAITCALLLLPSHTASLPCACLLLLCHVLLPFCHTASPRCVDGVCVC